MGLNSKKCTIGFVLSVLSFFVPILPIVSLVLSAKGMRERAHIKNRWMGIAGIILSLASFISQVVGLILLVSVINAVSNSPNKMSPPDVDKTIPSAAAVQDTEVESEASSEDVYNDDTETDNAEEIVIEGITELQTSDIFSNIPDTQHKGSDEVLPEIGDYDVYPFWGKQRKEADNGY